MKNWLKKNSWWLSLVLTAFIGLFPKVIAHGGFTLVNVMKNYWLQISLGLIISLLLLIIIQQKKDPTH